MDFSALGNYAYACIGISELSLTAGHSGKTITYSLLNVEPVMLFSNGISNQEITNLSESQR